MVRNAVRSSTFTLNLRGGRAAMTGSAADSFTEKDQHDLNRYVGIRERRKEMKVEIKQLQEEMDGLQEAKDEVETMDEETAKDKFKLNYPPALGFRWAETFTTWEPSAISQFLDYKLRLLEGQGKDMENDLQEMTENMIELHQRLTDRWHALLAIWCRNLLLSETFVFASSKRIKGKALLNILFGSFLVARHTLQVRRCSRAGAAQ